MLSQCLKIIGGSRTYPTPSICTGIQAKRTGLKCRNTVLFIELARNPCCFPAVFSTDTPINLNAIAHSTAQQHVNRQTHSFATDIPQRVIQARHCGKTYCSRWKSELLKQLEHDVFNPPRIFAFNQFKNIIHRWTNCQIGTGAITLSPPVNAFICFDLHQRTRPLSHARHKCLDCCNLHIYPPTLHTTR